MGGQESSKINHRWQNLDPAQDAMKKIDLEFDIVQSLSVSLYGESYLIKLKHDQVMA
jgi:hypothetical protein